MISLKQAIRHVGLGLFFFSASLFPLSLYASSSAATALKERLESIRTWQAQFVEQVHDGKGQMKMESKGLCALKRPGYFFWKVLSPNRQTIYVNPEHVWMVDDDLAQATEHNSDDLIAPDNPVKLLMGSLTNALSHYHVTRRLFAHDMVYRLTPLNTQKAPFERVVITIHKGHLSSMDVTSSISGEVSFRFLKVKQNHLIPDTYFAYVPTEGIDVVKQT